MNRIRRISSPGRLPRAAAALLLLNVLVGALPLATAFSWDLQDGILERASTIGPAELPSAAGPEAPSAAAPLAPPLAGPPTRAPIPLSVGAGWQNWTPYSPSAFTHGSVPLTVAADAVVIDTLPNVTVNQTGTVTVLFNGTWNPAPPSASDRDWILVFVVINGHAEPYTIESNSTLRWVLAASDLPARFFFGLPSPVPFVSPSSSAVVTVFAPSSNNTTVSLSGAAARMSLASAKQVSPIAADTVWFNASGTYTGGGILNNTQNASIVLPLDGVPPVLVRTGVVSNWMGPANFSGARLFLLTGSGVAVVIGGSKVTMWTRGSPESGLFANATLRPTQAFRGDDVNVTGVVGGRTLGQSTNWVENNTPVLAPYTDTANCNTVLRLKTGQFRLLCVYHHPDIVFGDGYGVVSAISSNGRTWAWEGGVRYSLCSGQHPMFQITVVALPDGRLRMYYGGQGLLIGCPGATTTHISSAISSDEGSTWSLESETLSDFVVGEPDAQVVVPTRDGRLRMYVDRGSGPGSGPASAVSDDGLNWTGEADVNIELPRTMYALADGSYKMYFGATSVFSRTSANGINWNTSQLEATWSGNVQAGPLLDLGNGSLLMLAYSQTNGLLIADLGATGATPPNVNVAGKLSNGQAFGATVVVPQASGQFETRVTVPAGAPLGRMRLTAAPWFGGVSLPGVVLNRPPIWTGPASVNASEDVPLTLNLSAWVVESDRADTVNLTAVSAYGALNGSNLSLLYPAGVASEVVTGTISDGYDVTVFSLLVNVLPVNDPPRWDTTPAPSGVVEGVPWTVDLLPFVSDEDNSTSQLSFSSPSPYATFNGSNLTLLYPNGVLNDAILLTVSDGLSSSSVTVNVTISPANGAPQWDSAPAPSGVLEDVPWVVDLKPFVSDQDNATGQLTFTVASPYAALNGSNLTLLYPEGVLNDTILLTVSDGLLSSSITVNVTIAPVNDAPVLTGTPPTDLPANGTLTYQFGVSDPDNASGFVFTILAGPPWITISPGGLLNITAPPNAHGRINYTVQVSDGNGAASAPRNFTIALPANLLPFMTPTFANLSSGATPGAQFTLRFEIVDPEGDPIAVTLNWSDASQAVVLTHDLGNNWTFDWTPTYVYNRNDGIVAWLNGSLLVNDTFGDVRFTFAIRATDPPNNPPFINGVIHDIVLEVGQRVTIDLTPFMTDPDAYDPVASLNWSFEGDESPVGEHQYDPRTHEFTFVVSRVGNATLTFKLSDQSRLNDSQIVFIRGLPIGSVNQSTDTFPWWLLLLLLVIGVAGVAAYWKMRGGAPAEAEPLQRPAAEAPAPAATPLFAPAGEKRHTFLVEDVFLLYRDGRTIFSRGGLGADAVEDPESVGAMLVAVQSFVRESFKKGDPVDRMGYGDNVILIQKGDYLLMAVTIFGEPTREFRDTMAETVQNIEASYAGVIEKWDGNRTELAGVEPLLAPIWLYTANVTRGDVLAATTAREVQMLSGVEFFQGFVRAKVAVVNNTATVITGVTLDLDYNADVLRLHKIEPGTYKTAGAKVALGVLNPGERVTLAYYFDPQICTSSGIDGSTRYRDAQGAQHIVQMKRRTAEVVCPLFFTKEQANTAMLKRLIETELNQFDVRAYSFKEGASDAEAAAVFEALKSAVLAHDVQIVRSFERRRPYSGEAWFYGKTQVKGYEMVIRALVDGENKRAEFFVGSSAIAPVTGLLAELSHTFGGAGAERLAILQVAPLFDEGARGKYEDSRAVSKMLEGEAEAGEND